MDDSAGVYAAIINGLAAYFKRVNLELATTSLREKLKLLDSSAIKYQVQYGQDQETLTVLEADEHSRPAFYSLILELILAFERQYGVDEVWSHVRVITSRAFQSFKDLIRDVEMEVPIVKYRMDYRLELGMFDFNRKDWVREYILVTNRNLVFYSPSEVRAVPLDAVAIVGREFYSGFSGSNSETPGSQVRAIDYKADYPFFSCAVVSAKDDVMKDFLNTVKIMRAEVRRLNDREERALIAVYNNIPPKSLASKLELSEGQADEAFKRVVNLGYADLRGHITPYGITVAAEILQSKNLG
jgi:hypothetical protein